MPNQSRTHYRRPRSQAGSVSKFFTCQTSILILVTLASSPPTRNAFTDHVSRVIGFATGSEANCTSGLCCRANNHNKNSLNQTLLPAPRYGSFLWCVPLALWNRLWQFVDESRYGTATHHSPSPLLHLRRFLCSPARIKLVLLGLYTRVISFPTTLRTSCQGELWPFFKAEAVS